MLCKVDQRKGAWKPQLFANLRGNPSATDDATVVQYGYRGAVGAQRCLEYLMIILTPQITDLNHRFSFKNIGKLFDCIYQNVVLS